MDYKKADIMIKILKLLFILLLLLLGLLFYYLQLRPLPLPYTPFEFSISQGAGFKKAASEMKEAGILKYDRAFVLLARVLGKDKQLKAGNYEINEALTPLALLDMISKGSVATTQIRIVEGWTFRQFRNALAENTNIKHDTSGWSDRDILKAIGATESRAEGLFFPDTYYFAKGSSELHIYQRAYQTMQQHLQTAWQERATNVPLKTPYQALILASIVEKETGIEADRDKVAAVFVNRLRIGMLLQTDPTVIYGVGERFDGNLRKIDLLTDTPYNTYTRKGLPPTPISLPGLASIKAALHPAKTKALYFVARGDGSSEFSNDLNAHNRAVNRYQR